MAANMNNTYGDGNGYVGNLNLNPETSHTVSLSVDWHDMKKRTSSLRATSYFTYVIDYIDAVACTNVAKSCPTRTDGFSTLSFDNQSAKIYGFDLSVYKSLGIYSGLGQLSATGMVSYVRGENDDTNDNLFRQMPLNLKVSMDQQVGQWVNRIEGILVDEKSKVSEVRNEGKTSGYALLNIFSTYQYQQTRLTFGITNALNKNYNDPLGGAYLGQGATMKTGVLSGTAMPGTGRSFNMGLTFDF
jgi:iron complex outermembrane receptor protein